MVWAEECGRPIVGTEKTEDVGELRCVCVRVGGRAKEREEREAEEFLVPVKR
jgi:hypothetical protein